MGSGDGACVGRTLWRGEGAGVGTAVGTNWGTGVEVLAAGSAPVWGGGSREAKAAVTAALWARPLAARKAVATRWRRGHSGWLCSGQRGAVGRPWAVEWEEVWAGESVFIVYIYISAGQV
mmetsp:Transcript_8369/g.15355  ORF Transcript_8369/g.15355 Transcript_8369/m.15355 type:complete len:120 (+) Transcript_8369:1187-1546(+)